VSTVLAVFTSEGCVGRCDATCHNATTGECDCICGGRNHGAGHHEAVENTRALVIGREGEPGELSTLATFAQRYGIDPGGLDVHAELPLFA
jgi:hypothetical protein